MIWDQVYCQWQMPDPTLMDLNFSSPLWKQAGTPFLAPDPAVLTVNVFFWHQESFLLCSCSWHLRSVKFISPNCGSFTSYNSEWYIGLYVYHRVMVLCWCTAVFLQSLTFWQRWMSVDFFCRLDGRHVVFGKVISGLDVVYKVEAEGTQGGTPKRKVMVADSGELQL